MTKLDELVTQIALALHRSAPNERWARQAYRIAVPNHWRETIELGQPRWCTMTVRAECTGKFTVNFEYLDKYPEGGIHRPVPHPDWVEREPGRTLMCDIYNLLTHPTQIR